MSSETTKLLKAALDLRNDVDSLWFKAPVVHVYNPLSYAWEAHKKYLEKYGQGQKRVVFLGMNPGPFGMMQTGVPFGEVNAVKNWLGIEAPVGRPATEHARRPISGFACPRSEVSGKRLWGLFAQKFVTPERFFENHFVVNYCPLVFLLESGANLTPNKLPVEQATPLFDACDKHLVSVLKTLKPDWVIGIGTFAEDCAKRVVESLPNFQVGRILHPSPASPSANHDWASKVTAQLKDLGVW